MKNQFFRLIAQSAVITVVASVAIAQSAGQSGDVKGTSPLSHDLSGVWASRPEKGGRDGRQVVDPRSAPPMTPWGKAKFDASIPSLGPRDIPGKENDPALFCYPDGFPKILTSNEPFEIINIPGRVLMFFEKDHGWRQVWTDGRKLPVDPPELRYDGYSVGHWEGDTFVVESTGFNDKLWLDYYGSPHSDAMRLTERYQRLDHDTLSITVTIDDPKTYTKPWVGQPKLYTLKPGWEIAEWYCTLDDENQYDNKIRLPTFIPEPSNK